MLNPEPVHAPGFLLPGIAQALCYQSAGQRLIDRIDLELTRDTLTVVMGANGAGKSLLLRLMHGMLAATGGEITWGGAPLSDAVREHQAMVFQRPVLLRRSVAANIRFALKLRKGKTHRNVVQILDEVGLASRAHQPARLLSGGEQQRLNLARALALEPSVLFLDEPTASLDPASTAAIEGMVQKAHVGGTKIVFVTHDLGQARRLADDVVFLDRGRLAEHTPAALFFDRPQSEAARDYLAGRLSLRLPPRP